jgi:hypothetical protein
MCKQRATYCWKALNEGYNYPSDLIAIGGLHAKLCASKVAKVPSTRISRLSFGSFGTKKAIWMWPLWRATEYTIRGKVVVSPKSELWWILWIRGCSWLVLAPKMFKLCTNHFELILCKFVWVIEACQFFLIPSRNSNTPLYPSKCCELGNTPNFLFFHYFQFGTHIWILQGLGARQYPWLNGTYHHFY